MQGAGSDRTGIVRGHDAGKPPIPDAFAKPPHAKYARILDVLVAMMPACMAELHALHASASSRSSLPHAPPPAAASDEEPFPGQVGAQQAEAVPSLLADVDAVDKCALPVSPVGVPAELCRYALTDRSWAYHLPRCLWPQNTHAQFSSFSSADRRSCVATCLLVHELVFDHVIAICFWPEDIQQAVLWQARLCEHAAASESPLLRWPHCHHA